MCGSAGLLQNIHHDFTDDRAQMTVKELLQRIVLAKGIVPEVDWTSIQTAYLQIILTTGTRQRFVSVPGLFASVALPVRCHQEMGQQSFTAGQAWME